MNGMIIVSGLVLGFLLIVPLGLKWELDKKVLLSAAVVLGLLSGVLVYGISAFYTIGFIQSLILEIILITAMSGSLLLWRFFRDPEREPPEGGNTIISPADGVVIYNKRIEEGMIPISEKNGRKIPLKEFVHSDVFSRGGHLIGISMSFLDVHVNRAPLGGTITHLNHIQGSFLSLKRKEAVFENERVCTVIDNGDFKVGIVQIASRLVRRIVPYMGVGDGVQRGQRMGLIRFGSQVDVIIPDSPALDIRVVPRQRVTAGVSILATVREEPSLERGLEDASS